MAGVRIDYTVPGFDDPRNGPICGDRGPRIGTEGVVICKRPEGHKGCHLPDPDDGWGVISWARLEDLS